MIRKALILASVLICVLVLTACSMMGSGEMPQLAAGCIDSSTTLDSDIYYHGPINQASNVDVFSSTNGSCTRGEYTGYPNATMIYFVGTVADAQRFCDSLMPVLSRYIENLSEWGYSVPNEYFWLCV